MRTTSLTAAAFLAAAVLTFPSVAHAQAVSPTPQQREQARNAMDEGDKKRDGGDLVGALAAYERGDDIMNVPSTAIEVARTQVALGKLIEADATLQRIAKMEKKPGEPAPFTAARKAAETMATELAQRIPTVVVVPANLEAGQPATITIDGEPVPPEEATSPRKVNPGAHKITVKSGTLEKTVDVTVAEKEAKTVDVDLKDQPSAPPPPPPPPPKSGLGAPKLMMYGGFGLAAVGIGVGAVTGLMSMSKTSDLKDRCPNDRCPAGSQGDIDSATTLGNISTVAFIAGAVGAGVGVVGLVLSGKEKKEEAPPPPAAFRPVDVRAVLGPSYAGLAGRF
ncbi:MAG: hypothetical protein KIT84_21250 [Labilithrix sp.]|nr:hypothetical protein [Labilithrix sp.]MCW5813570.1 hypothetical protein [Labilithrix sp.]